jgi:hypothetical protein
MYPFIEMGILVYHLSVAEAGSVNRIINDIQIGQKKNDFDFQKTKFLQ